jgi:hypothetical protein
LKQMESPTRTEEEAAPSDPHSPILEESLPPLPTGHTPTPRHPPKARSRFSSLAKPVIVAPPTESRRRPVTVLGLQGHKLVAESVSLVRPIKYDPFEVQERVCASLPTATATPKLFTKTRGFHDKRSMSNSSHLANGDFERTRRMLDTLAGERQRAMEIATKPQGNWTNEAEMESAQLFMSTLYQTKPY